MNPHHINPSAGRILHYSFGQQRNGRLVAVVRCTNEPTYLIQSKVTHDWAQVSCPKCLKAGKPEQREAA